MAFLIIVIANYIALLLTDLLFFDHSKKR